MIRKLSILLAVAIFMVACIEDGVATQESAPKSVVKLDKVGMNPDDFVGLISLYPRVVGMELKKIVDGTRLTPEEKNAKYRLEEFLKFDFSDPLISSSISNFYNVTGWNYQEEPSSRKRLSDFGSKKEFIFTFQNSVLGQKTNKPELIAFISGIDKSTCDAIIKTVRVADRTGDGSIPSIINQPVTKMHLGKLKVKNITSLNIPKEKKPWGCVEHGGVFYYYNIVLAF